MYSNSKQKSSIPICNINSLYKKITSTLYTHLDGLKQVNHIYICTAKSITFEFKWYKNQKNFPNLKISHFSISKP